MAFDQQVLYLFEQVHPGSQSYHIPMAYRIRGPLDVGLMERSLAEIVRRH